MARPVRGPAIPVYAVEPLAVVNPTYVRGPAEPVYFVPREDGSYIPCSMIDPVCIASIANPLYVRRDGTSELTGDWGLGNSFGLTEVPYVAFDTTFTDGAVEGRLQWNIEDGTLEFGLPGGTVNLQLGQEMVVRCRNTTGVQIDNGSVVEIIGASGNRPLISLADASDLTKISVIGMATEDIGHNSNGYVNTKGFVRDVNTNGMVVGEPVWLSATTPGGYTQTRPTAPDFSYAIGLVIVAGVGNGVIYNGPIPSWRMMDSSDVLFDSSPSAGEYLSWKGTRFELTEEPFAQSEFINISSGAGNAGEPAKLDATGKWDVSMIPATGGGTTVINLPMPLDIYLDRNQRFTEQQVHGGLDQLITGDPLDSSPTDITLTTGIGKLVIVINAGGDVTGEITVTGTSVDRNTGIETPADTDTITVDALTTDTSDTDARSNPRHALSGAYITSKWFTGSVTLSTANLTLTDVDVYHCSFEQFNDEPDITLTTFDINVKATNANAWLYSYLYTLEVTGDKCDITRVSSVEKDTAGTADRFFRLRRGDIGAALVGTTDGIFADVFFGPANQTYWDDFTCKIWATANQDVSSETVHGSLSGLLNDDHPQYPLLAGRDGDILIIDQIRAYDAAGLKLFEDGGTGLFIQDSTGNVGIGTDAPGDLLHLKDGTLRIENSADANQQFEIRHNNDGGGTNPYIRFDSDGNLVIEPSSIGKLYLNFDQNLDTIFGTGNVGIGTTGPNHSLEVFRASGSSGDFIHFGNGTHGWFFQEGTGSGFVPLIYGLAEDSNDLTVFAGHVEVADDTGTQPVVRFDARQHDNTPVEVRPLFQWSNLNSPLMTMDKDGKVGIGTTAPLSLSHVDFAGKSNYSHATVAGSLYLESKANGGIGNFTTGIVFGAANGTAHAHDGAAIYGFQSTSDSDATGIGFAIKGNTFGADRVEAMRILSDGNVGIGTAAPAWQFHLHRPSGSGTGISITNTDTGVTAGNGFLLSIGDAEDAFVWNYENTPLRIGTNSTERMTILAGGNVGIGTAAPTAKLHVDKSSSSAAISVLKLDQADLGEGFIDFLSEIGSGDPIDDVTAVGGAYARLRIRINGATKYIQVYNAA